jgi:hypothetical protein
LPCKAVEKFIALWAKIQTNIAQTVDTHGTKPANEKKISMLDSKFKQLFEKSKKFAVPDVEKNIFFIGGRGHYENPISDLLAFFMDIHEVHGFGDLVLKSINEVAGFPVNDVSHITSPQREVVTDDGKRIDILVVGDDYVTMIENKIRHSVINPFKSYEDYLTTYHVGKRQNLLLLSVCDEIPPAGWTSITYEKLLIGIKKNLGEYIFKMQYSKWLVLFREFLMNIEQECNVDSTTDEQFEFVKNNYDLIRNLEKMAIDYRKELANKGCVVIKHVSSAECNVFTKQDNWGNKGIAIRLISSNWGGRTNITLLLLPTGGFCVQFYVYDIQDCDVQKLRETVGNAKYEKFWTEQKTIRCFGYFETSDLDEALAEVEEVVKNLNAYYLKK